MPSRSATAINVAVALLFLSVTGWLSWPVPGVHISSHNGAQRLDCWLGDARFALRWRHSVERQLWFEHYRVAADHLLLEHVWLQTFGAGTPHTGTPVAAPPGFVGLASGQRLPGLDWTVSPAIQGELHTAAGRWPVASMLPPYTTVTLRPARPLRFTTLTYPDCHDLFVPHPAA